MCEIGQFLANYIINYAHRQQCHLCLNKALCYNFRMQQEAFQKAYNRLNAEQKLAVDTIEGPVMVIAGPGTGKTSILTLRIANILKQTDTSPDSILALTFTESGVHSMREKLVEIIGASAYRVNIFTFHGFANSIIEAYPEYFPRIVGGSNAPEVEQLTILERIFESGVFEIIKPFGNIFYYVRPALASIKSLKREHIDPEAFLEILEREEKTLLQSEDLYHEKGKYKGEMKGAYKTALKKIEKNKELAVVYKEYEKALMKQRLYDFEDMIIETIHALKKNPDLLLILQEEYQYVLADEHQDANNAQNEILELISGFHESPNLFIVGDEKQAIYRFQGASLENFLYFKRKYPDATLISLKENYRSTQSILDSAHTLISHNAISDQSLRVSLEAKAQGKGTKVTLFSFQNPDLELRFIVEDIEKRIAEGASPREIAILYRDNADAYPIVRAFEKTAIPFAVYSDDDVLKDPHIAHLVLLIRTIHAFGDEELITKLMLIQPFGLSPLDCFRLIAYRNASKKNIYDILRNEKDLIDAQVVDPLRAHTFYLLLEKLSTISKNAPLLVALQSIIRESRYIPFILSLPDSLSALEKLDSFVQSIQSLVESNKDARIGDCVHYIDTLILHGGKLSRSKRQTFENRVSLMTAHRSKGLEYDYVYIFGVTDGKWGNKRSITHFSLPIIGKSIIDDDNDEDERRLFYVALTRARQQVIATYAESDIEGKQKIRSQFIEEIISHIDVSSYAFGEKEHPLLVSPKPHGPDMKDAEYLQKLFLEQGLNVTALNNYITCPWRYFFQNLIRIPHAPEKHQMYGIAVHAALKELIQKIKKGESPKKEFLLNAFERSLSRQPLSSDEYEESKKKGIESLSGYFEFHKNDWDKEMIPELSIPGVMLPIDNGKEILLRGQIDRIDIMDGYVRVIDYKTGKIKSRNDILGETKTSEGGIKRQLDFYKLLLDLYENGKYVMEEGRIDFVEPNEKGMYKSEVFSITNLDKEVILQLVKEKALEIYNVSYWDTYCDDKDCEFCALRRGMNI